MHTAPTGFTLRIFMPSGNPTGVKFVSKTNWTGSGLVIPRALLPESRKQAEFDRAGVYLLVGQSEVRALPTVYIGEGDPVGPRIDQHQRNKDFWTHLIIFTSRDDHFNKAHVQRLESRLVQLAKATKRCVLDNGNAPQLPTLSSADAAEADAFLWDMLLCLPALGFTYFETPPVSPRQLLAIISTQKNVKAQGFESAEGFVVMAGSQAAKEEVTSNSPGAKEARTELIKQGVIVLDNGIYRFDQAYTFSSPSLAAGVILGKSTNGRDAWRDENGRTLKEIQELTGPTA